MTITQTLFSFEGRIPRSTYWLASFGMVGALIVAAFIVGILGAVVSNGDPSAGSAVMILIVPMYLCMIWCSMALSVKRWHDRGKSGLWMFIQLIPLVGPLWAFIELGCLEGTQGPNEFGEQLF